MATFNNLLDQMMQANLLQQNTNQQQFWNQAMGGGGPYGQGSGMNQPSMMGPNANVFNNAMNTSIGTMGGLNTGSLNNMFGGLGAMNDRNAQMSMYGAGLANQYNTAAGMADLDWNKAKLQNELGLAQLASQERMGYNALQAMQGLFGSGGGGGMVPQGMTNYGPQGPVNGWSMGGGGGGGSTAAAYGLPTAPPNGGIPGGGGSGGGAGSPSFIPPTFGGVSGGGGGMIPPGGQQVTQWGGGNQNEASRAGLTGNQAAIKALAPEQQMARQQTIAQNAGNKGMWIDQDGQYKDAHQLQAQMYQQQNDARNQMYAAKRSGNFNPNQWSQNIMQPHQQFTQTGNQGATAGTNYNPNNSLSMINANKNLQSGRTPFPGMDTSNAQQFLQNAMQSRGLA